MRKLLPQARLTSPRGGTTLTEVLMALLCMGIGVVAVAALFPIALLRSVQATQLTSATILRFNAETLIDLHDQDPTIGNRNLIFNPDFDADFDEDFRSAYLIDPLGAMIVRGDNGLPLNTRDTVAGMPRYDGMAIFGLTTTEQNAESIVTLPDSWITLYDEFPSATINPTSVEVTDLTLAEFTDIENLITTGSDVRVVLFSGNGRLSEARTLTAGSIDTANSLISWATPLPSNGQYTPVSRVRVEVRERRYTWLLTVRNDTSPVAVGSAELKAQVDVVVFFRRAPSLADEQGYRLSSLGGRRYSVINTTGAANPFVKKGGFMLNTSEGTWHRIQLVEGTDAAPQITLERNTSTSFDGDTAVFMRGVVDVYPLGTKQ